MEQLLKKLLQTLIEVFARPVEITFEQDQIVKSTNYDLPQSRNDITDITFTNMSSSGLVYVKNVPLDVGESRAFGCNWNEINKSNFDIRFAAGATLPLLIVDYKVVKRKA